MTASIEHPEFDEPREREGFRAQRARVGRQAGTEKLGARVWDLPPGQAVCLRELFRRADAVDYWEGEEPPPR